MEEEKIRCPEIRRATYCPYSILSENLKTNELRRGEILHKAQAKEIEKAILAKSHRTSYVTAAFFLLLIIIALFWLLL